MRFPNQIYGFRHLDRYPSALEMLTKYLLKKEVPDIRIVRSLFGAGSETDEIYRSIQEFSNDDSFVVGKIRDHNPQAPTEISNKRTEIAKNPHFNNIRRSLLQWEQPKKEDIAEIYAEFTDDVYTILGNYFELFIKSKFEDGIRRDGLSSTVHVNWVGGIAYALENDHILAAQGMFHDVIEELLRLYGGIKGYDKFLKERIPEIIREPVRQLTNHYALILHDIKMQTKGFDKDLL